MDELSLQTQAKGKERQMASEQQPSLPAKRAFVVQVHADAKVEHGQWQGRVEHLASAQATHFQSSEELLAFIVKVLSEPEPPEETIELKEDSGGK